MDSCYKNVTEIRNVTLIFQNFQFFFQKRRKKLKIHMDSEKSIHFK